LSGAPKVQNDFRDYTATWTVSGSGRRRPISARAAAAGARDSWTHSGADARASIRLFVPVGTSNLRIASGQIAVKMPQGMRGTGAAGPINVDLDEWRFQYIDVLNGVTLTTLNGSRTQTRTEMVGWRPPPGTTVTETCTWNLAKSAVDQSSNAGAGGRPTGSGTTGSGAAGAAGAKGGATSGTSTATSNPVVTRPYAAIGRTPTPGAAVVFATLFDASGAPLVGVPTTDVHLLNGAKQPVGIGPYVFSAAGDIVDGSALGVTFSFNGSSRVAFLDVPVGMFTLSVSTFVAGSVRTRSVQVVTTAGAVALVQLSSKP
jgi:hypothetical protein